jgi:hypothetical protein
MTKVTLLACKVCGETLLACKVCGEKDHIYFKHIYQGMKESVWAVECQRCYSLVPVVSYMYDIETMTAAWNEANG